MANFWQLFGSFAGGLGQGAQQGLSLWMQYEQMRQNQLQRQQALQLTGQATVLQYLQQALTTEDPAARRILIQQAQQTAEQVGGKPLDPTLAEIFIRGGDEIRANSAAMIAEALTTGDPRAIEAAYSQIFTRKGPTAANQWLNAVTAYQKLVLEREQLTETQKTQAHLRSLLPVPSVAPPPPPIPLPEQRFGALMGEAPVTPGTRVGAPLLAQPPLGAPAPAPPEAVPPIQPTPPPLGLEAITLGPAGPSARFGVPEVRVTFENVPIEGGRVQRMGFRFARNGQLLGMFPVGIPQSPDALLQAERAVQGLGFQRGTTDFESAVNQYVLAQSLEPSVRAEMFARLQRAGRREAAVGVPPEAELAREATGAPSVKGALEAAEQRQLERLQRESEIRRGAEPLAGPTADIVTGYTNVLALANRLETFSVDEINRYVGVLTMPAQTAKNALRSIAQQLGLPTSNVDQRFQEFKALVARFEQTLFDLGGKQLTATERQTILRFTATGREPGGAVEFLAKVRGMANFARASRALRLKLAREGRAELDPEALDALMQVELERLGLGKSAIPLGPRLRIE